MFITRLYILTYKVSAWDIHWRGCKSRRVSAKESTVRHSDLMNMGRFWWAEQSSFPFISSCCSAHACSSQQSQTQQEPRQRGKQCQKARRKASLEWRTETLWFRLTQPIKFRYLNIRWQCTTGGDIDTCTLGKCNVSPVNEDIPSSLFSCFEIYITECVLQ